MTAEVFTEGGRRRESPVDEKTLHAMIGQPALENTILGSGAKQGPPVAHHVLIDLPKPGRV